MSENDKLIDIPPGPFLYGADRETREIASAYSIGKYPVTNAEYSAFVTATGHAPPRYDGPDDHPITGVTWHDAVAYCAWVGARLPTEKEWERAARGTDGREYPWGDWAEGRCNSREAGMGTTSAVGQYSPGGDSPDGCVDMVGNVWEWTASERDGGRVLRGGSWRFIRRYCRCAYRGDNGPGYFDGSIGFRVVFPGSGSCTRLNMSSSDDISSM